MRTEKMARVQKLAAVAAMSGVVLFGGVACGGSSTVSAPTTPVAVGSDAPSTLPATTAPSGGAAPSGFPGSTTNSESPAEKQYITDLRAKGFKDDEVTLIQAGRYVCDALSFKSPPQGWEQFVEGVVGRGRTQADATSAANTVIATAKSSGMCKK
jgi:hypothetical protein